MAYVKKERKVLNFIPRRCRFKVGDWAVTRKKLKCEDGYFEKGTKVRVIGITAYGYDVADEHGNYVLDTGFHSIK